MEEQRLHVLNEIARHRKLQFDAPPVRHEPMKKPKKPSFVRRTKKLDPDSVRAIRVALAEGESVADVAARFDVSTVTITHVKTGRSWSDVE